MDVSTPADAEPDLSPLEQEVLDEYAKLVGNLDDASALTHHPHPPTRLNFLTNTSSQLSNLLADLASKPSAEILDALRGLERKTTTVFTLLKASVYSIVLQQEIFGDEHRGEGGMGV